MRNKINLSFVDKRMKEATLRDAEFDRRVDDKLAVKEYPNAVIYPGVSRLGGGVVDQYGDFVKLTSVYNGIDQEGPYAAEVRDEQSVVVYLGMFYSCWGHCITDCLKHLWILISPLLSDLSRYKFVYTTTNWGDQIPPNFRLMLDLLGLDIDHVVRVDRPTRFEKVLVPDSCIYSDFSVHQLLYTTEYSCMIALLIERALIRTRRPISTPTRKVFFTRSGIPDIRSDPENDRLLDRVFKSCGYEIVRPETLGFVEMVALLSETKSFAAPDGSCAHNAIFLPRGAESVVVRRASYVNKDQSMIDQLRELHSIPIDANFSCLLFSRKYPMLGPFFVYVNKNLSDFSGVKRRFPFIRFGKYVFVSIYKIVRHAGGDVVRAIKRFIKGWR